jgi:hypothetical protein
LRSSQNQEICLICNPQSHGVSKLEKELFNFIEENYNQTIIENYRISNQEIDIYLPGFKYLEFEFKWFILAVQNYTKNQIFI